MGGEAKTAHPPSNIGLVPSVNNDFRYNNAVNSGAPDELSGWIMQQDSQFWHYLVGFRPDS